MASNTKDMREIKFRAWNPKLKVFTFFDLHTTGFIWKGEVSQYTGLKDKNGKEIFEGDVVNLHLFTQDIGCNLGVTEGERIYKGVIEFWEFGIALNIGDNENNFYLVYAPGMLHEESFDVIGNIYENPELTD